MSYLVLFFAGYFIGTIGVSSLIPTFVLITGLAYSTFKNLFSTKDIKAIDYKENLLSKDFFKILQDYE